MVQKLCNDVDDFGKCNFQCFVTGQGHVRSKCKHHQNLADKLYQREVRLRISSRQLRGSRMENCRLRRKATISSIENDNVRRIALKLDSIRDNSRKYVIISDVIDQTMNLNQIKLRGKSKSITFTETDILHKRSMQPVSNHKKILSDVLLAIKIIFPLCPYIVVKLLTSEAGDVEQSTHLDYVPNELSIKNLSEFHFSAIISFEEGTVLLVGSDRIKIPIPLSSMLFFRGDMPPAGAGYSEVNRRLFISVSCDKFPVTDDVSLFI
jgi:hypothetical protein